MIDIDFHEKTPCHQVTVGLGLALMLLIANAGISYRNILQLTENERRVIHTQEVLQELTETLSALQDVQTGQRGYVITGNDRYLEPYNAALERISTELQQVEQLTKDNPAQQRRMAQLQRIVADALANAATTIKVRREQGFEPAQRLVVSGRGKRTMDSLRDILGQMRAEENRLLQQRSQESQATLRYTLLTFSIASLLSLLLFVLVYLLFRRDSMQRQQAAAILKDNEARLQAILDGSPAVIYAKDPAGRFLFVNQEFEQLFQVQREQIIGRTDYDFFPQDLAKHFQANDQEVYQSGSPVEREEDVLVNGKKSTYLSNKFPLKHADGETYATCGISTDVTARRQAEAEVRQLNATLEQRVVERTTQLKEANEELEAFTYSISHDLRAPLRAIQGFADALREDYGDQLDDLGKQYAQRIITSAERLEDLIQDLLAYSRLARLDLRPQAVDLGIVLSEAMTQVRADLEAQHAQVTIQTPLPAVLGHRVTLVQVVANLLTNAIKFVEAGVQPQVNVGADILDRQVRLWITDNGIGIAPEHQERIFRVFERLHGTEIYPGTGIGLAIVRKSVERMGGQVGVESELGQGSRFWVELKSAIDET